MINDFIYDIPVRIYFGRDQLHHLGSELKQYGTRVLMNEGMAEQEAEVRAAMPDTRFCFRPRLMSSTAEGWRATEDNLAVRKAFTNWQQVTDFRSIDDVEYRKGVWLVPVQPSYE